MRVRGVTGHRRIAIERWEVAAAPAGAIADPSGIAALAWVPCTVPNTAAGALRAAKQWSWDDKRNFDADDWWWRAPLGGGEFDAGCVLGFDGIATLWDAWLDGVHVASGDSMWRAHELAIAHPARELVIRCRSLDAELATKRPRPRWRVPMLEQQQLRWFRTTLLGRTPGWSPPCAAVGPWRAVWLEQRTHPIGNVDVRASVDGSFGVLAVRAELGEVATAKLVADRDGQHLVAALARQGDGTWAARLEVPKPALWWPHTHGTPSRYTLNIVAETTSSGDVVIELGAIGFRTIEIDRGDGRDFAVRVNGVPVFCRGACWTPLDAVTLHASPTQYGAAVRQLRAANMNMLRIGGTMTYEHDALHDALDEHGVLLWQDLMLANMDYPEDPGFVATVRTEVEGELDRLATHPSLAVVCGNSEGDQQAAMWGASRERWQPPLFHTTLAELVAARGIPYVPSSACGGAFPHAPNAGPSSYYGVGAYLRDFDDARRSEVVFGSECLAFANVPHASGLPSLDARVHHPLWKARGPRDRGAGWDFDDVRDHYVQRLYTVDPALLRTSDHERYLQLGRAATGEVMQRTFAEWRRARSVTRGGLVWFLRDLWPGSGWGVVDAHGTPKPAYYALRRAFAPLSVAITDEGNNGLAIHLVNDDARPVDGKLELALWRGGNILVARGAKDVRIPASSALELPAAALFDNFMDLSFAYRFGPPVCDVVHAQLAGDFVPAEAFWFPAGLSATRELEVGLTAKQTGDWLVVRAERLAQHVAIDLPGWLPADDWFHLAPGQQRTIALERTAAAIGRGTVTALNAETAAKIDVSQAVEGSA